MCHLHPSRLGVNRSLALIISVESGIIRKFDRLSSGFITAASITKIGWTQIVACEGICEFTKIVQENRIEIIYCEQSCKCELSGRI